MQKIMKCSFCTLFVYIAFSSEGCPSNPATKEHNILAEKFCYYWWWVPIYNILQHWIYHWQAHDFRYFIILYSWHKIIPSRYQQFHPFSIILYCMEEGVTLPIVIFDWECKMLNVQCWWIQKGAIFPVSLVHDRYWNIKDIEH